MDRRPVQRSFPTFDKLFFVSHRAAFARSSSSRNKRARFRRSGTYIMRANVWITRFPNWFLRRQRQRESTSRPSTKKRISIHSAHIFIWGKKKKINRNHLSAARILRMSEEEITRERFTSPSFYRFFRSNVGYLFHQGVAPSGWPGCNF